MNKSQQLIKKFSEENSSINNVGEIPKGVINPLQKKKKKKIKDVITKYERFVDSSE